MEYIADGFVGSHRPVQVLLIGVPVALIRWFQEPEPFQTKRHVLDFILMNRHHDRGAFRVARFFKIVFEFERVIEVSSFECQRDTGEIVQHRLKVLGFLPDVAVDW